MGFFGALYFFCFEVAELEDPDPVFVCAGSFSTSVFFAGSGFVPLPDLLSLDGVG